MAFIDDAALQYPWTAHIGRNSAENRLIFYST